MQRPESDNWSERHPARSAARRAINGYGLDLPDRLPLPPFVELATRIERIRERLPGLSFSAGRIEVCDEVLAAALNDRVDFADCVDRSRLLPITRAERLHALIRAMQARNPTVPFGRIVERLVNAFPEVASAYRDAARTSTAPAPATRARPRAA